MSRGFKTLAEQVDDLRAYSKNPQQRVRTGLESLDTIIEGPAAGEIALILGRSFTGKSLLATSIMASNSHLGVVFFSLEMTSRLAVTRLFAQWAGVDHHKVQDEVTHGNLTRVIDTMAEELPKHVIVDVGGLSYGDMTWYLERYADWYGERADVVIIDYLELVGGAKATGEGWTKTEAAAAQLQDWAKEQDMPVYMIHQTNMREPVWKPPNQDSARGAGYTESDLVIGLWAPGRDPELSEMDQYSLRNEVHMNVIKNRISGETRYKPLPFTVADNLRFVDKVADQGFLLGKKG